MTQEVPPDMFLRQFKANLYMLSILFLCLSCLLVWKLNRISQHPNLEKKLADLTTEEREYLNNFFRFTVTVSTFGYTLFGDKPMSIETFQDAPAQPIEGFDYMDNEHILNKYRLREG